MSGKRLLKRVVLVWGLAAFASLFLLVADGNSTPLRPDIRKLVSQPSDTVHFAPARAGWNGPESGSPMTLSNPAAADFSVAAAQRATRAALLTAALPDPRAVVAIAMAILLLRLLRRTHQQQARRAEVIAMPPPPEQKAA